MVSVKLNTNWIVRFPSTQNFKTTEMYDLLIEAHKFVWRFGIGWCIALPALFCWTGYSVPAIAALVCSQIHSLALWFYNSMVWCQFSVQCTEWTIEVQMISAFPPYWINLLQLCHFEPNRRPAQVYWVPCFFLWIDLTALLSVVLMTQHVHTTQMTAVENKTEVLDDFKHLKYIKSMWISIQLFFNRHSYTINFVWTFTVRFEPNEFALVTGIFEYEKILRLKTTMTDTIPRTSSVLSHLSLKPF